MTSPAPLGQKKVIVAMDDGEESENALRWALQYVIRPCDLVHILHAQRPYIEPDALEPTLQLTPGAVENENQLEDVVSKSVLQKAVRICHEYQIVAEGDVIVGHPQEGICSAVVQLEANLLVIGSHGYGIVTRTLVGSVSDYCVHNAACPVLVVKQPSQKV
eukprot:TRINITY_DN26588_c0_g1_i1.p1 TRINITY_DN26588_c0_g1~~TRINITY_DN26588_c0_g1_i1.p1  ORF type:complete len:161 (-),score=22.05 TRINITY_DN26588_c0_g1_i1:716-1198(-)